MTRLRSITLGVMMAGAAASVAATGTARGGTAHGSLQVAGTTTMLPASTPVYLTANADISSRNIAVGDRFEMSVARDVMLGDYVVIPRGAPAHGQIIWRTGRGAFGKSAKMEFELVDIDYGGRLIRIGGGRYRVEGRGNSTAAIVTAVAVGTAFSALVIGHSAVIGSNIRLKAYTWYDTPVTLGGGAAATTGR